MSISWFQRFVSSFAARPRPGDMDGEHGRRGSIRSIFGRSRRRTTSSTFSEAGDQKEKPRSTYVPKYASKGHLTSTVQQDIEDRSTAGTHAGQLNHALTLVQLEQKVQDPERIGESNTAGLEPQIQQRPDTRQNILPSQEIVSQAAQSDTLPSSSPPLSSTKPTTRPSHHRYTDSAVADIDDSTPASTRPTSTQLPPSSQNPAPSKYLIEETKTVPEKPNEQVAENKHRFRDSALGEDAHAAMRAGAENKGTVSPASLLDEPVPASMKQGAAKE